MKEREFSLVPFGSDVPPGGMEITGKIGRLYTHCSIRYRISGAARWVEIPALAKTPARTTGLWRETCFEFFLAIENAPGYWELNLSPAGHWDVYRFTDYRQGMERESALSSLPFCIEEYQDYLLLSLDLDLSSIIRKDRDWEVGISAVVKHKEGALSYWALVHCGDQPDFHRRDSFIVKL
jgi:hypothetical protein